MLTNSLTGEAIPVHERAADIPITVVDMAAYRAGRRGLAEGTPERIVGITTLLIGRHHRATSDMLRDELLKTITHLVVSFGPHREPLEQVAAIRACVDSCGRLLDRHEPSVELDAEIRRETALMYGVGA